MNATYFNIVSTAVMGILLIMLIYIAFKKYYDKDYKWGTIFYIMFFFVVAHAALSLTVTFTKPGSDLDTTIPTISI